MSDQKSERNKLSDIIAKVRRGLQRVDDAMLDERVMTAVSSILGGGIVIGTILLAMETGPYTPPDPDRQRNGCEVSVTPLYEWITQDILIDYDVLTEECGHIKSNYRVSSPGRECKAVIVYEYDMRIVNETIEKGDKYDKQCMELKEWIKTNLNKSYFK
jgi:hypothetical protein